MDFTFIFIQSYSTSKSKNLKTILILLITQFKKENIIVSGYPWDIPSGILAKIWWLCFFPVNLLFFLSIPDVRRPKCVKWFPLSFFMCIAWIGVVAYEVTWLITVIGYTIQVPDTVMGLSFLAVGTSIPEVFSSLIVSKQVRDHPYIM